MQSKKSYFSKTIFLKNIVRFWPIWVGYLIINLILLPVRILFEASDVGGYDTIKEATEHVKNVVDGIISTAIAPALLLVVAVVVAWCVFSYLYAAKSANMMHALPVCREQLFFTNLCSGLFMIWIPQFITFLAAIAACSICQYGGMSVLAIWLGYSLGISFVFYSFAVFAAMITGNILAVPMFYAVCMFLVSGLKCIIIWFLQEFVYGMSVDLSNVPSFFSPGVEIITKIGYQYTLIGDSTNMTYRCCGIKELFCYIGVSVIFIILGLVAYKKRHLEVAGEFTAFHWMRPVFRWGFAFCASICFSEVIIEMFFWNSFRYTFLRVAALTLASGLVAFVIAQMIVKKSFHVFYKRLFCEWGIYTICMLGFLCIFEFDLTGYEKAVPELADVKSVSTMFSTSFDVTDEASIQEVLQIHQSAVDNKEKIEEELNYDSDNYDMLTIDYTLKNGKTISREYPVPSASVDLSDNDSLINQMLAYENEPQNVQRYIFGNDYDSIHIVSGEVSAVEITEGESDYRYTQIAVTDEQTQELYEAVIADIEDGNLEQSYAGDDYDTWSENTYYNDIYFSYYTGNDTMNMQSVYISFHPQSSHILGFLEKYGMVSKDQLITQDKINEIDEKYYGTDTY